MDQLITFITPDEPRVSSIALAEGTENQHKNVLGLIHSYRNKLETFGGIAFQTASEDNSRLGGRKPEFALLNENQATVLITLMKNSPVVVDFKVRLVKAFSDLKRRSLPQTYREALECLIEEVKSREIAEKQIEVLSDRIQEDFPKVDFFEAVGSAENTVYVDDLARSLKVGRNTMFEMLRDDGYLMTSENKSKKSKHCHNRPYQKYIDQGLFRVVETTWEGKNGKINTSYTTHITGKGQQVLVNRYSKQDI